MATTKVIPQKMINFIWNEQLSLAAEMESYIRNSIDSGLTSLIFCNGILLGSSSASLDVRYAKELGNELAIHVLNGVSHVLKNKHGTVTVVEGDSFYSALSFFNFSFFKQQIASGNKSGGDLLSIFIIIKKYFIKAQRKFLREFLISTTPEALGDMFLVTETSLNFVYTGEKYYVKYNNIWIPFNFNFVYSQVKNSVNEYFKQIRVLTTKSSVDRSHLNLLCSLLKVVNNSHVQSNYIDYVLRKRLDLLFEDKLNKNPKLLPFKNGVLCLDTFLFRPYLDSDYFSIQLSYEFHHTSNFSKINSIFNPLFLNLTERQYVLQILSTLIDSSITNNFFFIFKGQGSNGKSLLIQLLSLTFGPFSISLASNFFSNTPQIINGPSPFIKELMDKKVAFVVEPDQSSLKANIIKKFCGSDRISARSLFSNKIVEFDISTKFILAMNDVTKFDIVDYALSRRLLFINFNTTFVDNPTQLNQRKLNRNLFYDLKNDKELFNEFFNLLLSAYKLSKISQLEIPESFKNTKNLILSEGRDFTDFIKENLIYSEQSYISVYEILKEFYAESTIPESNTSIYRLKFNQIQEHVIQLNIVKSHTFRIIKYGTHRKDGKIFRGFKHLKLRENE